MSINQARYKKRYLHIRTPARFTFAADQVAPIARAVDINRIMEAVVDKQGRSWVDGTVFRFWDERTIPVLGGRLKNSMPADVAWVLHDGDRECVGGGGTLAERHFAEAAEGSPGLAQIFLRCWDRVDASDLSEEASGLLGGRAKRSLMFRDGCVLLVFTNEPAHTLWSRLSTLTNQVNAAMIIGAQDGDSRSNFPDVWDWTDYRDVPGLQGTPEL